VEQPRVLHELLVQLGQQLGCDSQRFGSLRRATSIALKPLVLAALERVPQCVVLEDVTASDPRMYRFLQQIYHLRTSCLIVTTKSRESLGHVRKLLWDPREEIVLKPLTRAESISLFDAACRLFQLESLDVDEFRPKVLAAAQGNPGQILAMCRLAVQPEYRQGKHIRFLPLRMDVLPNFVT